MMNTDASLPRSGRLEEFAKPWQQGQSVWSSVTGYIERRHLPDGGYFFARVPPSSGMDTYFAVKSLSILGLRPERPEAVAGFFLKGLRGGSFGGLTGLFLATEVLNELGRLTVRLRNHIRPQVMTLRNRAGGFGAYKDLDAEVPSELRDTYRSVKTLKTLGAGFDEQEVSHFVLRMLNPDGGYGPKGHSTLASTFYAAAIHGLVGQGTETLPATRGYLRRREEDWQVQFIEDLYYLVLGLANLGENTNVPERVRRFVTECQRSNGGFSRATVMGIPTLEYTYYALSILSEIEAL